jgi:hypothetical protein
VDKVVESAESNREGELLADADDEDTVPPSERVADTVLEWDEPAACCANCVAASMSLSGTSILNRFPHLWKRRK